MTATMPATELNHRFSSNDATPTEWAAGAQLLEDAEVYWLSSVRPDGRPHVTPLIAVWMNDALFFCTGQDERKAANLAHNAQCAVTTGCNTLNEDGLDVVIEGTAARETDEDILRSVADAYVAKYGEGWRFVVHDGAFRHASVAPDDADPIDAHVYRIAPLKVFGFGKGTTFSQTRWRF